MSKIEEFKKKLSIDEHGLEFALRDHPNFVYDVGMELALAISHRDEAKQSLEEIEASVDAEIREEAAEQGEKITEKEVESHKKVHDRVKKANQTYLNSKLNASQWSVLKEAFDQRSYALSKLVDLYLANYYSDKTGVQTGHHDIKTMRADTAKSVNASRRVRP